MKDEIQVFNNPEFGSVRTLDENGAVLFCASDVATSLGYVRPNDAVATHCRAAVKRRTPISGKMQEINFIPESDLYRLVFRSKLPAAEKFTEWVTSEVQPSIRRSGGYINGQESMTPEELMAQALMVAQKTLADREARISSLTVENQVLLPKAQYFDELVERNTLTNFRETAKELGVPPKKFTTFLLDKKYIYRDRRGKLLPTEAKNEGLFEVKESYNEKTKWSGTQTLITPKGRETFRLLMIGC